MTDDSFKDFIIDELIGISRVTERKMFGSFGLYSDGIFFAIISDNVLYFKTNNKTRGKYVRAGSDCSRPSEEQILKNYFEVPTEVLEDRKMLTEWALEAIEVGEK